LPVEGGTAQVTAQTSPIKPPWQRWNDYGIGCYIEGGAAPSGLSEKKGELKQAEAAFRHLIASGEKEAVPHGWLNLARVQIDDAGRLAEAAESLNKAGEAGAPWWTVAWFKGVVAAANDQFDDAIGFYERILNPESQPRDRAFDFRLDFIVWDALGKAYFKRSQRERHDPALERSSLLKAIEAYERTLKIESEDLEAHYGLFQCYHRLAEDVPEGVKPAEGGDLTSYATTAANAQEGRDKRLAAALTLVRDVPEYCRQPLSDGGKPAKLSPHLPTVLALIARVRPAFEAEKDDGVQAALADALATLHQEAHAIYKPDDNARDYTVRKYRAAHPAANHAAEAIVIYPTTKEQIEALLHPKSSKD
jgi:tetratricopeptide (TPR) repeat protein